MLERLLTSFVTGNLLGYSLRSRHSLYHTKFYVRANTIRQYLYSINRYYEIELGLRPIWHKDDRSEASRLLKAYDAFEEVARRRARIPDAVLAKIAQLAVGAHPDSFEMAMYRWVMMGVRGGFRSQEYAQDTRTGKPKVYILPKLDADNKNVEVLRAFAVNDFIFSKGDQFPLPRLPIAGRSEITKCGVRHRYQKNEQNGQVVNQGRNPAFPQYDFVELAMATVDTARRLGQADTDPLAVYLRDGAKCYVTGKDVTAYLREVTRLVFPDITEEQLDLISSHSIRVTAAVLLHEEGKDGTYIKLRLRWLSD